MFNFINEKILHSFISLGLFKDYCFFKLREHWNQENLERATSVNKFYVGLTMDSNVISIFDSSNNEKIGSHFYKEGELVIYSFETVSIKDCKDTLRAFYGNPYLQVFVSYKPKY